MTKQVFIILLLLVSCAISTQLQAQIIPEIDASQRTRQGDKIRLRTQSPDDLLKMHTLFLVDEKPYNYEDFEKLMKSPDDIQSIHIVKDPKEVAQYTSDKKYQAIIKVILKK
jgi:hypothetical protein